MNHRHIKSAGRRESAPGFMSIVALVVVALAGTAIGATAMAFSTSVSSTRAAGETAQAQQFLLAGGIDALARANAGSLKEKTEWPLVTPDGLERGTCHIEASPNADGSLRVRMAAIVGQTQLSQLLILRQRDTRWHVESAVLNP